VSNQADHRFDLRHYSLHPPGTFYLLGGVRGIGRAGVAWSIASRGGQTQIRGAIEFGHGIKHSTKSIELWSCVRWLT